MVKNGKRVQGPERGGAKPARGGAPAATVACAKQAADAETRAEAGATHAKRRTRVKMSDAMRIAGMDEHKFAKDFSDLADRVNSKGKEKLQLEVLKEWSKQLDGTPALRAASAQDPVPVQYITKVPNPVRDNPIQPPIHAEDSLHHSTAVQAVAPPGIQKDSGPGEICADR
ncbi:MAG: hypothetical protein ACRD4K_01575 [Candidatus Acidiferrales bacterium]